jgi:crotonobetainyl-CoA:carnitine CoA-transferase CaiB-like acyl-CoA transferase
MLVISDANLIKRRMLMALPLEGIRVIDVTQFQQGPVATLLLADMGAEVIKVEPRGKGDPGRHFGPFGPGGTSAYFECNNRSKKSITVDTRTEKGKEIVYRLIKKSDVFAQNFRPGVAKRLGFGYEKLSEINPRLIYLTGSAFGLKGPMGEKPGYDAVGQAMAGLMSFIWSPPGVPQTGLGFSASDQSGGFMLAFGAMIALFNRERTGQGQEVDVSLLGSTITLIGWSFQSQLTPGGGGGGRFQAPRARISRVRGTEAAITSSHYTKDGKPLALLLNGRDLWEKTYKVLGLESSINHPKFANYEYVRENLDTVLNALDEKVRTKDRDEWINLLDEAEAIAAPVNTVLETAAHPQVVANEYVAEIDHPREGRMRIMGLPVKLHKTPGRLGTSPELGQHIDEVLTGIAGYTPDEVAQMRKEQIV